MWHVLCTNMWHVLWTNVWHVFWINTWYVAGNPGVAAMVALSLRPDHAEVVSPTRATSFFAGRARAISWMAGSFRGVMLLFVSCCEVLWHVVCLWCGVLSFELACRYSGT